MTVRIEMKHHWGGRVERWTHDSITDCLIRFETAWEHKGGIEGVLGYTIDEQVAMDQRELLEECAAHDMQSSNVLVFS